MPALTSKSKLVTAVVVSAMVATINGNDVQLLLALQLHVGGGKLQKGTQPSLIPYVRYHICSNKILRVTRQS